MAGGTFKTAKEEAGETLCNFTFRRGEPEIADRAYGTLKGMNRCRNRRADYIPRPQTNCFAV
jgi:hypothetical protein